MSDRITLGDVIATREFRVTRPQATRVVLLIGKPKRLDSGDTYYCPYQITGTGDEKVRYAAGIDAVQSLQLAMGLIGADLAALDRASTGTLRWVLGREGGKEIAEKKGEYGVPGIEWLASRRGQKRRPK